MPGTLESEEAKHRLKRCRSRMVRPWRWDDMCSETATEKSLWRRPWKLIYFTERIQPQATHALPGAGHKVAALHSHSSGQPLQGEETEFPGLQKPGERLVLATRSGWPSLDILG